MIAALLQTRHVLRAFCWGRRSELRRAGLNQYVTEELAFEFHYFFTRKFWMLYHCQALVVAPGGFGTLDELFEVGASSS